MKSILKEHMGSGGEKTKAKHPLQMSSMQSAKDCQDTEMANMCKEISTLTQAPDTLTHKMMDKSSKRGGGGDYKSDTGYATDESEKENTRPQRKNKWKHLEIEKQQQPPTVDDRNTGN